MQIPFFFCFPGRRQGRGLFLLLSLSPGGSRANAGSCVGPWAQESQEKVLCKTPASSRGDRPEPSARFPSLTAIPKAPQLFGFGFQPLFLEGLGCSVEIKHFVVYRHLVTHYLVSTMMYEQPLK